PCYCRGTLILTKHDEVRIEDLAIGDMVVTISGEAKPIKWICRRSDAGQFIAGNRAVLPIVVRAGALAPNIPARDLGCRRGMHCFWMASSCRPATGAYRKKNPLLPRREPVYGWRRTLRPG